MNSLRARLTPRLSPGRMAQCVARLLPFPRLVSRAALGRVVGASNVASRCMSIASGACYVPHPAKRKLLPTQKVFTALCMPGGVTFVCCGTVGLWQRTRAAKTLASFPPTVPLSVRRECAWGPPVRWAHAGCVAALADGVGGWASQGVDAGVYSKTVWLGSLVGTSRDIERDVAVLCS